MISFSRDTDFLILCPKYFSFLSIIMSIRLVLCKPDLCKTHSFDRLSVQLTLRTCLLAFISNAHTHARMFLIFFLCTIIIIVISVCYCYYNNNKLTLLKLCFSSNHYWIHETHLKAGYLDCLLVQTTPKMWVQYRYHRMHSKASLLGAPNWVYGNQRESD